MPLFQSSSMSALQLLFWTSSKVITSMTNKWNEPLIMNCWGFSGIWKLCTCLLKLFMLIYRKLTFLVFAFFANSAILDLSIDIFPIYFVYVEKLSSLLKKNSNSTIFSLKIDKFICFSINKYFLEEAVLKSNSNLLLFLENL